jgi:NADH-quinone oxidoreductase subunit M
VARNIKEYNIAFFFLEFILIGVFCSLDILLFYLLFEAVLIPMFFVVGVYGSRGRRVRASYLLFLYTLLSSIFMLVAILALYFWAGTTDFLKLQSVEFDPLMAKFCWVAFFLSFGVKMPLVPFHVWLPEAHAEAPTAGSVILAGILLKLGGYGFLRFSLGLFPEASSFFTPLIFTISIFGVLYASLTTIQQVDLKKIIAYSSVGHMGLVTIGIFSGNIQGILGSILLMISHGLVSGGLFLCIGVLYERHHTRIVKYYSGLIHTMPLFVVCFIIFTLGNIGLPATSSFIGEFLIVVGCFEANSWAALLSSFGMVLGVGYSLWLCNRIAFGNKKQFSILEFKDLTRREFYLFAPFLFLTFLFGLYPDILLNYLKASVLVF